MMIVSPWKETPRRLKKWRHMALRYLRKAWLMRGTPKERKKVTIRNRKNYQKAKKLDRRIKA